MMDSDKITRRVIMNDALVEYSEIIEEELHAYEALGDLYSKKEEILVQGNSDALWDIDSKIVEHAKNIKQIEENRQRVALSLGNENITLSEVIEKVKVEDKNLAQKISSQKEKLGALSKKLILQQKTHMSLIEHGLKMVEKTMDIIFNVASPQS